VIRVGIDGGVSFLEIATHHTRQEPRARIGHVNALNGRHSISVEFV
jgi:hypothetical protein